MSQRLLDASTPTSALWSGLEELPFEPRRPRNNGHEGVFTDGRDIVTNEDDKDQAHMMSKRHTAHVLDIAVDMFTEQRDNARSPSDGLFYHRINFKISCIIWTIISRMCWRAQRMSIRHSHHCHISSRVHHCAMYIRTCVLSINRKQ